MNVPHVLIVDDDTALLEALPETLQLRMGSITIDTADSATAALERIAATDYDAVVTDIKMPGTDGLALLERIAALRPGTPTLLITGHGERDLAIQALRGGAYDFIQKPIDRDYIVASLRRAIQMRRLSRQVEEQRQALERHATSLEQTVLQRTRELVAANQVKDELLHERDDALAVAEAAGQRLAFLAEASAVLASSLEYESVLSIVTHLAVPRLADWCVVDTMDEDGVLRLAAVAHVNPARERLVRELRRRFPLQPDDKEGTPRVLRTGKSAYYPHVADERLAAGVGDEKQLNLLRELGITSYMCVPMVARGHTLGAISLVAAQPDRHFGPEDLALAEDLARRAAVAADNARLYHAAQDAVAEQKAALLRVESLAQLSGRQAAELDAIFEAIADGVFVSDGHAEVVRVNAHGAALMGMTVEQALQPIDRYAQTSNIRFIDGTPAPIEVFPLKRALRGETCTNVRFLIRRYDAGEDVHVRVSASPIRDAAGDVTGAVAVVSDIDEVVQLERQKDEFLSIASHELKTPLASLKVLTQLTRRRLERADTPVATQLVGMERAIGRMEMLVNDLLDISRIESGKLALRQEPCDFVPLCRQMVDEQSATTDRIITFDAPDAPLEVTVDVDRMGQVLTNLLSNALKYSQASQPVHLRMRQDGNEAIVCVQDHGPGISPAELTHIFDRFYRVPGIEVQSGSGVGLGLGLYISHEIVERHGGRIWAESTVGNGSTFCVALPLAAVVSGGGSHHQSGLGAHAAG
jgi:PAS domain S-box-containing protein